MRRSKGAAFAAGMAEYISKRFSASDGGNHPVEAALYLSPDEADEFSTSTDFKTYEAYYNHDWISPDHGLKGVDYQIMLKNKWYKSSHGKTVSKETITKLKQIVNAIINMGDFNVTETSDAIIFNRKSENN